MVASRTIAIFAVVFSVANVIPAAASFSHVSDPDFFWLPPTVPTKPTPTGPFDATALDELVIEICQLVDGACTGPLVERMSAAEASFLNRIRVYPRFEFYAAEWLSLLSHVQADRFYRVRALRNGFELGFVDVQVVKRLRDLTSVDWSRYVGLVKGSLLPLWFRIEQPSARNRVKINEVESSGGIPGDWIELYNTAAAPVSLDGYVIKDNDDTHNYFLPAGTTIAAGGYLVVEEAALGFGLGAADSARLYDPAGILFESYSWTAHAVATTYGRCPNGTGDFITTTSVTKGAANDCSVPVPDVNINEAESSNGVPGDWVELYNYGGAAVDVSGFVFRDSDDTHAYTIPAGTIIAAGGYYLLEEAAFGFGLGGADSVRLFDTTGALIDSFAWVVHATTTYGRCPNGTGDSAETTSSTKGTVNACPGDPLPWPGDADVQTADGSNVFGGNVSGLVYEGSGSPTPGVLWGARNGPGALFRLVWDGTIWTPDSTNGWGAGKLLAYPGGTGSPDAEGVTFAGPSSSGGMYVATERDNSANGISRNSILRVDVAAADTTLTATNEWNLTTDLPVVGPNLGMEAITWIPDTFLVSRLFVDQSKGPTYAYNPADYPNHGDGLFFVGLEANGMIYAYALDHVGGGFTRVATIASGFPGVMDLHFDRELNNLWAICDDTCLGRSAVLQVEVGTGTFMVTQVVERPGGMPNLNNEGFAITPLMECVGDRRPAFWADDSETGGHAIRRGTLTCAPF